MKYCSKCGKELLDEAVICPGCGCPVPGASGQAPAKTSQGENATLATSAVICAFLMPIVGLILGIIGNNKYTDPQLKNKAKSAIRISIGMWIVYTAIMLVMGQI